LKLRLACIVLLQLLEGAVLRLDKKAAPSVPPNEMLQGVAGDAVERANLNEEELARRPAIPRSHQIEKVRELGTTVGLQETGLAAPAGRCGRAQASELNEIPDAPQQCRRPPVSRLRRTVVSHVLGLGKIGMTARSHASTAEAVRLPL
jgi:hypothetical protein